MSYLDDLKENQLLTESYFYVPGPDNIGTNQLDQLSEEELTNYLTEDDLSELGITNLDQGPVAVKQILINLSHGEAAVGGSVAALAIAGFAAAVAAKGISDLTTPPECKKYSGKHRVKCNGIVKLKKKISIMQSKKTLCKNSKDPKVCATKVNAKIQQAQDKLKAKGTL